MDAIYLDHAATTPLRREVRDAMDPWMGEAFGNPSSVHRFGRRAAAALAEARERVAAALGARPTEIYFVRGGTESDNMAVRGRAAVARARGDRPRVAASTVEHSAVLESLDRVEARGGDAHRIPVDPDGSLDGDVLDEVLSLRPDVLSVMWVNNEVGLVLPVPELAARARAAGVPMHTDAVQAIGKIPVRVDQTPVDLLTVTGHKIYGPGGAGILFVREGTELVPSLVGGGQERGLRPGTEDVAGAVGLAEAIALAVEEQPRESLRLAALRDGLESSLLERFPDLTVHGGEGTRAPHVANLGVPGVDATALVQALDMEGVAVSSGSACHSGASKASHVLTALYGPGASQASVRFSLGHLSDDGRVRRAAGVASQVIERLRELAGSVRG
jgi:cysteine desulfurase